MYNLVIIVFIRILKYKKQLNKTIHTLIQKVNQLLMIIKPYF